MASVWLAALESRYRTHPSWFSCAAMYSGVNPFWDWTLIEAACCTSNRTTSSCPATIYHVVQNNVNKQLPVPNEAMWRAVFPFLVAASTMAPRLSRSRTTSMCPSFDARCNAFKPFWKESSRQWTKKDIDNWMAYGVWSVDVSDGAGIEVLLDFVQLACSGCP